MKDKQTCPSQIEGGYWILAKPLSMEHIKYWVTVSLQGPLEVSHRWHIKSIEIRPTTQSHNQRTRQLLQSPWSGQMILTWTCSEPLNSSMGGLRDWSWVALKLLSQSLHNLDPQWLDLTRRIPVVFCLPHREITNIPTQSWVYYVLPLRGRSG